MCYNVSIESDDVYERQEDFLVGLSTTDARIDLAPDSARITIVDNDGNSLLLVTIFTVFVRCTYLFNVVGCLIILLMLTLNLTVQCVVVIFIPVSDCDWLGGYYIICD